MHLLLLKRVTKQLSIVGRDELDYCHLRNMSQATEHSNIFLEVTGRLDVRMLQQLRSRSREKFHHFQVVCIVQAF